MQQNATRKTTCGGGSPKKVHIIHQVIERQEGGGSSTRRTAGGGVSCWGRKTRVGKYGAGERITHIKKGDGKGGASKGKNPK